MAVIIAQHHFSLPKFCGNRIRQGFTGEVAHHQQFVFVIPADVGEHLFVVRVQQRKVTMANGDLMITRAEEYFDIPIRKKSGAK